MPKYINLTQKLVWLEYLYGESIYILSILVFWILFNYFRYLLLTICIYFQKNWTTSKYIIHFGYFWILTLKVPNIFNYIYSDTQNISFWIGFGSGCLDNPFRYLTGFGLDLVLIFRIGFCSVLWVQIFCPILLLC